MDNVIKSVSTIHKLITSEPWEKYNPKVISTNSDGIFVEMDDIDERFLFYIFVNPLNGKVQVNEIDGFRKRWDSIEALTEYLNK